MKILLLTLILSSFSLFASERVNGPLDFNTYEAIVMSIGYEAPNYFDNKRLRILKIAKRDGLTYVHFKELDDSYEMKYPTHTSHIKTNGDFLITETRNKEGEIICRSYFFNPLKSITKF